MRFLVIDDNQVDLLIAKAVIHKHSKDNEAVLVGSVDEALHYLDVHRNCLPDIIFLDLSMPVKTGWDFLKEYPKLHLTYPLIFLLTSSVNEKEKIIAAQNSLVRKFLSKPLRLEILGEVQENFKQTTLR